MVTPPKKKEPKTVKDVFKQFEADQKGIDNKTFAKLVADCGLVDKKMTSTDFDLLFMKLKEKGQRKIQYKTFLKALEAIAEKKGMTQKQVEEQITSHGKVLIGTKADANNRFAVESGKPGEGQEQNQKVEIVD